MATTRFGLNSLRPKSIQSLFIHGAAQAASVIIEQPAKPADYNSFNFDLTQVLLMLFLLL